ncbi:diaminopimelate decarboxylase [bacterium]|nr:MAG: diaminopimelate decarboxylase [bacterium]
MSEWLAPGFSRLEGDTLAFGGVALEALAAAYGTPLVVFNGALFDARVAAFREAFGPDTDISYAAKAFLCVALARRVAALGLSMDVCSLGELRTAQAAAFPMQRLRYHGCGKGDDELEAALHAGVGRIIVDNREELERLEAAAARLERPAAVILRVNTGIEAHTHEMVRTAGENSKFGLLPEPAFAAARRVADSRYLRMAGLHSHIGSQIYEPRFLADAVEPLFELAAALHSVNIAVDELIAGGGFAVRYRPEEPPAPAPGAIAQRLLDAVRQGAEHAGVATPRLGIEPGRALAGEAGLSLYRVMSVKEHATRRFVIVDGSMADNPRPALYGSYHHVVRADGPVTGALRAATICGRSCESDEMMTVELPEDLRGGDLLAVCTTGAYTYSMASNYNRFAKPAVVLTADGAHTLWVRRERDDETLRFDVDT